jgi:3-(3-hydroxy-phenyl)propionate hydroxylase
MQQREQTHHPIPVVIVGAGPTGLTAANLLGMAGIPTLLLERNADLSDYPRAIAIDDEGLRICQALELTEAMLSHMLLDIKVHYLSSHTYLAKVAPISQRNGFPFTSTFYQPDFEAILLRGLGRFPHVQVRFQHTLESFEQHNNCVELTVRAPDGMLYIAQCAYLLACDGGKSTIRHALSISMQPVTLRTLWPRRQVNGHGSHLQNTVRNPRASRDAASQRQSPDVLHRPSHRQRWLVVDTIHDDDLSMTATFFCNPARPAATLPAPQKRRRWEFMLLPGEHEEALLHLETIYKLIQQGRKLLGLSEKSTSQIIRYTIYTFHALIAPTFSRGRIFLLGDAAHLMPPFGGQGMSSGLRDAHNLCWKLAMVLRGQMTPDILVSYEQERYPHVAQMVLFSSILGHLIMPTSRPRAAMRDLLFRLLNTIPAVREYLSEARIKPQPRYPCGLLIPEHTGALHSLVGLMLPQPTVLTQTGQRVLLDTVLGDGFAILRLYAQPEQAFHLLTHEIWQLLNVRRVCVQPEASRHVAITKQDCLVVQDSEDVIGRFMRHQQNLLVLVRPDRYIMGTFHIADVGEFVARLEALIGNRRVT